MTNTAQKTDINFYIGQPVCHSRDGRNGYITKAQKTDGRTFLMVGGPSLMSAINYSISVVWDDNTLSRDIDESTVSRWIDYAEQVQLSPISEAEALALESTAIKATEAAYVKRQNEANAYAEKVATWRDEHAEKVPSWAKAMIVAERIKDESDMMSDYHGGRTEEVIILGFSKHTRDLFDEMRKHCAHVPEVQHLSTKPEKPEGADKYWNPKDEHREKYSMGGGYYLKDGYRYSDGWKVSKRTLYTSNGKRLIDSVPYGRWEVVNIATRNKKAKLPPIYSAELENKFNSLAHIEEHTHTKKGFQMFIVVLDASLEREIFQSYKEQAQSFGGWYSRKWGRTPGGFAFEGKEQAESLLAWIKGDNPPAPPAAPKGNGEKLRTLADKMQSQIDHKLGNRLTNTPKRLAEANRARLEGERLQRTQAALYALADLHDAGTVPPLLQSLQSKKAVYDLVGTKSEMVPNGYHSYRHCTGEPSHDTPQALALWALLSGKTEEEKQADELRRKIDGLQFSKIPGYFPTPQPIIDLMLDHADIKDEHMILEPSAGSGAIADAVKGLVAHITCYEQNHTLCEILKLKGYDSSPKYDLVYGDFLSQGGQNYINYDRILMNPPFENLQDVDHVMHAFKLLKSGGRLVAIMSPAGFFHSTKKAEAFRSWFESLGGIKYDIPAGAFKESGTNVSTCLVVIDNE